MRTDAWVKAGLGAICVCTGGSLAGLGIANYVASGSFDFYKQPRMAESRLASRSIEAPGSSEFAFASSYRSDGIPAAPNPEIAAFID